MLKPIVKEDGVTTRERYLAKLTSSKFFGLWSYPNVYTDEGLSKNGQGKELCDLLVVSGDTAIIFSDKDIKFSVEKGEDVAWKRWFKKAVTKSAQQLYGAEKWLLQHSTRVFLDKQCTSKFPLELSSIKKIHLIAVTCNTASYIKRSFNSRSGSLIQQYHMDIHKCMEQPFHIGDLYPDKRFIHVLDEVSLDIVLTEIDTITDFIHYLDEKVRVIRNKELSWATGEEEIVCAYLRNRYSSQENNLGKIAPPVESDKKLGMALCDGLWDEFKRLDIYSVTKSYFKQGSTLDTLLERFSSHILEGNVGIAADKPFSTHEQAVRELAIEPRMSRAKLSHAFSDKLMEVPQNKRSSRLIRSDYFEKKLYVFLFLPRDDEQSDIEYRDERQQFSNAYALVAKLIHPHITKVVLIATDTYGTVRTSEDIYCFNFDRPLETEEKILARKLQKEEGILKKAKTGFNRPNWLKAIKKSTRKDSPKNYKNVKPKRNEPCACGSGKKYKKCCMPA